MRYFGGKVRIAKDLSKFINENYLKENNKTFVDLFCGSCNILVGIDNKRVVIGNDKHKYLISMWKELQNGWIPPKEITPKQYKEIKLNLDKEKHLSGFVGFGCSFAGKWWGGFAKDSTNKNYCKTAHNSTMKKVEKLKGVSFYNFDYKELNIKYDSIVYCDIPYKSTTAYCKKEVGEFNHNEFYDWCFENKNKFTILISEYEHNLPEGFKIVWKKESKQSIRNKETNKKKQ